jgi:hypothetical protein
MAYVIDAKNKEIIDAISAKQQLNEIVIGDENVVKTEENPLSGAQQTRAAALHEARSVLGDKTPFTSHNVSPIDLVEVAQWIVDGHNTWTDTPAVVSNIISGK